MKSILLSLLLIGCTEVNHLQAPQVSVIEVPIQPHKDLNPKPVAPNDLPTGPKFTWRIDIKVYEAEIKSWKDPFQQPNEERLLIERDKLSCMAKRTTISPTLELASVHCFGIESNPFSPYPPHDISIYTGTIACGDFILESKEMSVDGLSIRLSCELQRK